MKIIIENESGWWCVSVDRGGEVSTPMSSGPVRVELAENAKDGASLPGELRVSMGYALAELLAERCGLPVYVIPATLEERLQATARRLENVSLRIDAAGNWKVARDAVDAADDQEETRSAVERFKPALSSWVTDEERAGVFGDAIRTLRVALDMSLREAAELLGADTVTLSEVERRVRYSRMRS